MFGIPPLPPYAGLHPIIVHFPIAILMIAWVPVALGLIDKKRRFSWFLSGLMLLVVGTGFAFFAVMTGGASADVADRNSQKIVDAINDHEEIAELTRNLFIGITVIYLSAMILHCKIGASKKKMIGILGGVLIAVSYGIGVLALLNTGYRGGKLVYELGIHPPMNSVDLAADRARNAKTRPLPGADDD